MGLYGFIGKKNGFCLRGRGGGNCHGYVMIIGVFFLNVRDWSFVGCVTKRKKKEGEGEEEARRVYCV